MHNIVEPSTFAVKDGVKVFYRYWQTASNPKVILVIVHGLNLLSGYFKWIAEQLNNHNHEAFAVDLRRRDNMGGKRFYIPYYHNLTGNINYLVSIAQTAHPNCPIFLLGHNTEGC